jgi:DNA-binding NarL/FixJ family response regulator
MHGIFSALDAMDFELDLVDPGPVSTLAVRRIAATPAVQRDGVLNLALTNRELEVLAMMATGATNRHIAERLVIADSTVKSHVKRILRKLSVGNRSEAISQYLHLTFARDPSEIMRTAAH